MPLDCSDIAWAVLSNGFDDTVVGAPGFHHKSRGELLDALMVNAVGGDERLPRIQACQMRSRDHLYFMEVLLVASQLAMFARTTDLSGQVLVQTATKHHIDQLHSSAHAKHRLTRLDKSIDQFHLIAVSDDVTSPGGIQRLFPVTLRRDIIAAL